jgi:hypothetical protein
MAFGTTLKNFGVVKYLQDIPLPIPGGYLLGGLLIINLTAAYIVSFQWTLKKAGIQLIHLGIILLLDRATYNPGDSGRIQDADKQG